VILLFSLFSAAGPGWASTAAHSSIVVLLDASGSMKKTDPSRLRVEAFQLLLALSKDGDRLALCEFGAGVRDLSNGFVDVTGSSRVSLAADAATCGNSDASTDVLTALRHAEKLVTSLTADERRAYPPVVIFLTDGRDDVPGAETSRESEIEAAARAIAQAGAKIYGLGLSRDADRNLFRRLETATGGETFYAESSTDLLEGFFAVSRAIAGRWLIAEQVATSPNVSIAVPQWATGVTVAWFSTAGAVTDELSVNGVAPAIKRPLYQLVSVDAAESKLSVRIPRAAGKLIVDVQGELLLHADLPGTVVRGLPFTCTVQMMCAQGAQLGSPLFLQRATSRLEITHPGNSVASTFELYDDGAHEDRMARDGLSGANALDSGDGAATYELTTRVPFSPTLSASGDITVLAEPMRVRTQGFVSRLIGATLGRGAELTIENLTDVPFSVSLTEGGKTAPGGAATSLAPRGSAKVMMASRPSLLAVRKVPANFHVGDLTRPVWSGDLALLPAGALPGALIAVLVAFGLSMYFPRRTTHGFRLNINYQRAGESDPMVELVAVRPDGYPEFAGIPAPFDRAVRILPISGIWRKGAYLVSAEGTTIDFAKRRPPKSSRGYVIKNGSSWGVRAESSRATYTFYSKR
jgi:uncharacterized protein YegL